MWLIGTTNMLHNVTHNIKGSYKKYNNQYCSLNPRNATHCLGGFGDGEQRSAVEPRVVTHRLA